MPNHTTRLLRVERDGNPLRRFGHTSPNIGKLAPLDVAALRDIARLTLARLPPLPDPTLVIGMTESSLLLSWFLAEGQQPPVDLRFTSRHRRGAAGRSFEEPHSHGPLHFLALEADKRYMQTVIVEDELTTGDTLHNLILTVRDVAPRIFVATLRDLRPAHLRLQLQNEMAELGVELQVLDLSVLPENSGAAPEEVLTNQILNGHAYNPFGRSVAVRQHAMDELNLAWRELQPGALYVIGECVDVALKFWEDLPFGERPPVWQITRSPWLVDGNAVRAREVFEGDGSTSRYFLYNWQAPTPPRALIVGEAFTACIGAQCERFLQQHGIESRIIEVSAE